MVDFYHDIGVHTKFIFVVPPRENRQPKSVNKLILGEIKKRLDKDKGL